MKLFILSTILLLPLTLHAQEAILEPVEKQLFEAVNQERVRHGLHPLELSINLLQNARKHAGWMANRRSMTHSSYPVAENIAMFHKDVPTVMRAWLNSSGHRANILGGYKYMGISVSYTPNGTPYWCQMFSGKAEISTQTNFYTNTSTNYSSRKRWFRR